MRDLEQSLIEIIKYEVFGAAACGGKRPSVAVTRELFDLATRHDVAQLVGDYVGSGQQSGAGDGQQSGAATTTPAELLTEITEIYNAELYRALTFKTDLSRISMILNEAGIDFIPLKGAVIRDIYPKNWMRSQADIDLLVRPEDTRRAAEAVTAQPGYMLVNKSSNNTLIESKTGWIIELQSDLKLGQDAASIKNGDNSIQSKANSIISKVWSYAAPASDHRYNFTSEFFETYFFYQLSHKAAKQGFLSFRQMLDVFLLDKTKDQNDTENLLLKKAGLDSFAEEVRSTARGHFGTHKKSAVNIDEWHKLTEEGAQLAATIHPSGVSMRPLIRGGLDTVIVMPLRRELKRGDIVLFRRADGRDVMHRVWKIKKTGHAAGVGQQSGLLITTFGDGCWYPDQPITPDKVLGLAVTLKRARGSATGSNSAGIGNSAGSGNTRDIKLDTSWRRMTGRVWLFFSPLRRLYYRFRGGLRWIKRQIKKRL